MFTQLRQWLYPREFRINYSGFSPKNLSIGEVINRLEDLVKQILDTTTDQVDTKFIKEMATSVWRLEKRIKNLPDEFFENESIKALRRARDRIMNVFKKQEIEIRDYTGDIYDPDESWDDVGGEDLEGGKGIISEMGKPRIIYRGVMIQQGIPIVNKKED